MRNQLQPRKRKAWTFKGLDSIEQLDQSAQELDRVSCAEIIFLSLQVLPEQMDLDFPTSL